MTTTSCTRSTITCITTAGGSDPASTTALGREESGCRIDELAINDDPVHAALKFPPNYAIARVAGIRKSISAGRAFARFPRLRRKFWSGELWEDGCAARTVGDKLTSDLIRQNITWHAIEQATKPPELG